MPSTGQLCWRLKAAGVKEGDSVKKGQKVCDACPEGECLLITQRQGKGGGRPVKSLNTIKNIS